jgi:FkbM family methyltransferase
MKLKFCSLSLLSVLISCVVLTACHNSNSIESPLTIFKGSLDELQGPEVEVNEIRNFSLNDYNVYKIRGIGSFYIDNRDDLIKRGVREGNAWEPQFDKIMKQHIGPGTTVVDVGAHIGTQTLSMSKFVGNQGNVVAFEPQMKLFSELVHNIILNNLYNVTAYRAALGNTAQEIEMNPALPENEAATAIGEGGDRARMITLDSLNLENVSFIKIDVENYEYEMLKGAENTIRKYHPYMIVEIMGNTYLPVSNRTESVDKTVKLIEAMGYDVKFIEGSWSDWLATPKVKDRG